MKPDARDSLRSRIAAILRERALLYLDSGMMSTFGGELQAAAFAVGLRRASNWTVPLLAVLGLGLIAFPHSASLSGPYGLVSAMLRIVAIDVGVFAIACKSGYVMARNWRNRPQFVLELILTPSAHRRHVLPLFIAEPFGPWLVAIALLGLVDALALSSRLLGWNLRLYPGSISFTEDLFTALAAIPMLWMLALFHIESVRLALACFARFSIPGTPLRTIATRSALRIAGSIAAMVAGGMAMTLMLTILGTMVWGMFRIAALPAGLGAIACLASASALYVIGIWKRTFAAKQERLFARDLILYERFGAGETDHPSEYPREWVLEAEAKAARLNP